MIARKDQIGENEFVRRAGPLIWQLTTKQRGHRFHGARPCPDRSPYGTVYRDEPLCEDCTATVNGVITRLWRAWSAAGKPPHDLEPWVRARARSQFTEVLRASDAADGMEAKPNYVTPRLFTSADARLVELMKFFVRSRDERETATVFPVQRFARKLAIEPAEVQRRIAELEARCRTTPFGVRWWAANIEVPLMRRTLSEGVDAHLRRAADPDPTADQAFAQLAAGGSAASDALDTATATLLDAVDRVIAGQPPERALKAALRGRYDRRTVATTVGSGDFAVLVDIVAERGESIRQVITEPAPDA